MSAPAVRFGEREIPHGELTARAARVAGALSGAGVDHGDRVAIVMRNEPAFLTTSAACGLIGAVPVPANWHSRGAELRHVLSHSGARVVFAHSDLMTGVQDALPADVVVIEVPVPDELAAHYGRAPVTGRHPLIGDWADGHEPYAQPLQAPR